MSFDTKNATKEEHKFSRLEQPRADTALDAVSTATQSRFQQPTWSNTQQQRTARHEERIREYYRELLLRLNPSLKRLHDDTDEGWKKCFGKMNKTSTAYEWPHDDLALHATSEATVSHATPIERFDLATPLSTSHDPKPTASPEDEDFHAVDDEESGDDEQMNMELELERKRKKIKESRISPPYTEHPRIYKDVAIRAKKSSSP